MITLLSSSFFVAPQSQANPNSNVDIRVFYDALSPYGTWVNHPTYGEVWYPNNVTPDWRPYTDGYWANTDEYGWLWVANEPWGWAPFHYGRWAWDDWYGWVWVPGSVWAPAWVFWRSGGGYAAWSPMPPNVVWQPGVGLNISYFDYNRDLRWDSWIVVRDYDLPHRHMREHIFPSRENREIINRTHNTHNLSWNHNTIVNEGVPVREIETITRQPIEHVAPKVHDRINDHKNRRAEDQPEIIRLPMAAPSSQEIKQNEDLARRLDGKKSDGTRTEQPAPDLTQPNNQETKRPGRLVGIHTQPRPTESEQKNTDLAEPKGNSIPRPAIPESPAIGLGLENTPQNNRHGTGRNQESRQPVQQPSINIQESIPVQPLPERRPASVPGAAHQGVLPDAAVIPIVQPKSQPLESVQTPHNPVVEQQPLERLPRQQPERARQEAQQQQLQETTRQQETQNQQQMHLQRQQAERAQQEAQQQQQLKESVRQQESQNQQQMHLQRQQAERAQQEAQQQQQLKESVRQQESQNQQQMHLQRQQAERAQHEAQQQQQLQESARQQEAQQQMQRQQAERAQQEARQQQQLQESARQQEAQQQMQRQQAERAQQEARQQLQLQESARQQETQLQMQRQQAERAQQEARQQQQLQESARQQEAQQQMQRQQAERAQQEARQQQQMQESARQQQMQQQQAERARKEAEQKSKPEGANFGGRQ
jgi:hypothetical protein